MMSGLVLYDETFVTNHTGEHNGFLNSPVTNIGPFFLGALFLFFLGVRWFPPCVPIICELFEERSLELGGLEQERQQQSCRYLSTELTVKVGLAMEEVELKAEETEDDASETISSALPAAAKAAARRKRRMVDMKTDP
jgi:hypothetical protein